MTEDEWDAVINVHLKGTFAPSRYAAAYWREQSKAGEPVDGRIINTTSVSGIYGNLGQTNYGAAKAGIAVVHDHRRHGARPLRRHRQRHRARRPDPHDRGPRPGAGDRRGARGAVRPRWIAPIVTWLASEESADVTGRVFEASGQVLAVAEGWHRGPSTTPVDDPTAIGAAVADLLAKARANAGMSGETGAWPQTMLD